MRKTKAQVVAGERQWMVRVGIVTLVAIALLVAGAAVTSPVHGDNRAEVLHAAYDNGSSLIAGNLLQALGFLLLVGPLALLFVAARDRSPRVRGQLIGVIVAAPLFFAFATALNGFATKQAADHFVEGKATASISQPEAIADCRSQRQDEGKEDFEAEFEDRPGSADAACVTEQIEDSEADDAIDSQTLSSVAQGFGLAGRLGLAVALLYTCLWAMRTGLLTRFWGSLGMALGVASLLGLVIFLAFWFVYFGLLLVGIVPGGRPPAWAAGEAIPWPTPGERAAAEMEPEDPDAIDVEAEELPPPDRGDNGNGEPRRKRKSRD